MLSIDEIAVVVGGVAAIAWVNWFFFLSEPRKGEGKGKEEA